MSALIKPEIEIHWWPEGPCIWLAEDGQSEHAWTPLPMNSWYWIPILHSPWKTYQPNCYEKMNSRWAAERERYCRDFDGFRLLRSILMFSHESWAHVTNYPSCMRPGVHGDYLPSHPIHYASLSISLSLHTPKVYEWLWRRLKVPLDDETDKEMREDE